MDNIWRTSFSFRSSVLFFPRLILSLLCDDNEWTMMMSVWYSNYRSFLTETNGISSHIRIINERIFFFLNFFQFTHPIKWWELFLLFYFSSCIPLVWTAKNHRNVSVLGSYRDRKIFFGLRFQTWPVFFYQIRWPAKA